MSLNYTLPYVPSIIIGLVFYQNLFKIQGYSDEVDKLRERMKENDAKLLHLVDDLKESYDLNRLVVAPHKSYVRVLELSKTQAKKAEGCEGLFK